MKSGFVSPLRLADEKAESYGSGFTTGWRHGIGHEQMERERILELQRPIPSNINPPERMAKTKVRVLRAFYVGGRPWLPGEIVEVENYMARGLIAMGKAAWPK